MTYKEIISTLHQALSEGSGAVVGLNAPESPPEFVVLVSEPTLVGTELPTKKAIGTFTWEHRKTRPFMRENAVLWSAVGDNGYLVGVGASVDVRTAARAARLFPDRVVRLG